MVMTDWRSPFFVALLLTGLVIPGLVSAQDTVADPGFYGYPLTYQRTMDYSHPYPEGDGFYVYRVSDGSRAEKAGIERGHIIRSVDGETVRTIGDILEAISRDPSDTFTFSVSEIAPQYKLKIRQDPFYDIQRKNIYRTDNYTVSYRRKAPEPVTVYQGKDGRLFHRGGFEHTPNTQTAQKFSNPRKAEESGLEACSICFPEGQGGIVEELIKSQVGGASDFVQELKKKYSTARDVPPELKTLAVRLFRQRLRRRISPRMLLIDTDKYHAFGLENGTIMISDGLLNLMEGSRETAAQLAHQMAHMDLKHSATPVQKARLQSLIERAINEATGVSVTFEDIKEYSPNIPGFRYYSELIEQGYGEAQEREVTFFAMVYLYRAGFDMDGVTEILQKRADMQSEVHPRWLEYVLKHPYPSDIESEIKEWKKRIPKAFEQNLSP